MDDGLNVLHGIRSVAYLHDPAPGRGRLQATTQRITLTGSSAPKE